MFFLFIFSLCNSCVIVGGGTKCMYTHYFPPIIREKILCIGRVYVFSIEMVIYEREKKIRKNMFMLIILLNFALPLHAHHTSFFSTKILFYILGIFYTFFFVFTNAVPIVLDSMLIHTEPTYYVYVHFHIYQHRESAIIEWDYLLVF